MHKDCESTMHIKVVCGVFIVASSYMLTIGRCLDEQNEKRMNNKIVCTFNLISLFYLGGFCENSKRYVIVGFPLIKENIIMFVQIHMSC